VRGKRSAEALDPWVPQGVVAQPIRPEGSVGQSFRAVGGGRTDRRVTRALFRDSASARACAPSSPIELAPALKREGG
jgi:hypothetical protein